MALQLPRKQPWNHARMISVYANAAPTTRYILEQNDGIANGAVTGTTINLKVLGIGNGLTVSLSNFIRTSTASDRAVLTIAVRHRTPLFNIPDI